MKRFSAALRDAMTDLGWSDSELARRTGKRQSSVADWLSDERYRPTKPVLEAIMAAMPPAQYVPILIAHAYDQLPDSARDDVRIESRSTTVAEEPDILEGLTKRAKEILTWTARQLPHNDNLRDLLEINRRLLGG